MCAFEIESRREQRGQRDRGRQMKQAEPGGEGPFPHLIKQPACREQPAQAQGRANCQNNSDMVRLPDINEDFPRVEDVIDCDGVEARLELVKEEELGEEHEAVDEPEDKAPPHEQDSVPHGSEGAVRHDQHPAQQRDGLHKRREDIPMEAAQKDEHAFGNRCSRRFEGNKQDHPGQEPDG